MENYPNSPFDKIDSNADNLAEAAKEESPELSVPNRANDLVDTNSRATFYRDQYGPDTAEEYSAQKTAEQIKQEDPGAEYELEARELEAELNALDNSFDDRAAGLRNRIRFYREKAESLRSGETPTEVRTPESENPEVAPSPQPQNFEELKAQVAAEAQSQPPEIFPETIDKKEQLSPRAPRTFNLDEMVSFNDPESKFGNRTLIEIELSPASEEYLRNHPGYASPKLVVERVNANDFLISDSEGNPKTGLIPHDTEGTFRVGRDETSNIRIPDQNVSGSHLELTFNKGLLSITDLGSTNGTRLEYQAPPDVSSSEESIPTTILPPENPEATPAGVPQPEEAPGSLEIAELKNAITGLQKELKGTSSSIVSEENISKYILDKMLSDEPTNDWPEDYKKSQERLGNLNLEREGISKKIEEKVARLKELTL